MDLDCDTIGVSLRLLATFSAGVFSGSSWYINVVEHPARMTHDRTLGVKMWKPSFVRAASAQSKIALVSTLSSVGAYACLKGTAKDDISWLASGTLMFAVIPFTLAFIRPVNNELLDTDKCISKGDDWIEGKLNTWNFRHSFRTGLSLLAFGIMVYKISK